MHSFKAWCLVSKPNQGMSPSDETSLAMKTRVVAEEEGFEEQHFFAADNPSIHELNAACKTKHHDAYAYEALTCRPSSTTRLLSNAVVRYLSRDVSSCISCSHANDRWKWAAGLVGHTDHTSSHSACNPLPCDVETGQMRWQSLIQTPARGLSPLHAVVLHIHGRHLTSVRLSAAKSLGRLSSST